MIISSPLLDQKKNLLEVTLAHLVRSVNKVKYNQVLTILIRHLLVLLDQKVAHTIITSNRSSDRHWFLLEKDQAQIY